MTAATPFAAAKLPFANIAAYSHTMRRIAELIQSNLNLRVFLPILMLALATTWYGLFWSVDYFARLTGGLSFMDMQPGLTATELFDQIRTYTDTTVTFYVGWSLFDYAWPFITFTAMCFISAWLINFLSESWRDKLWLLIGSAYATVLMDWIENTGFILLVLGLPAEPMWLAQTTLVFHAAKLFFNMVFNLGFWILLVAVIALAIRRRLAR
jgi:hypothetical protein